MASKHEIMKMNPAVGGSECDRSKCCSWRLKVCCTVRCETVFRVNSTWTHENQMKRVVLTFFSTVFWLKELIVSQGDNPLSIKNTLCEIVSEFQRLCGNTETIYCQREAACRLLSSTIRFLAATSSFLAHSVGCLVPHYLVTTVFTSVKCFWYYVSTP